MTRSACTKSLIVGALILLALGSAASAHDIWINKERRTNAAGEWCCNTFDCAVVPEEKIRITPRGYVLDSGETIGIQTLRCRATCSIGSADAPTRQRVVSSSRRLPCERMSAGEPPGERRGLNCSFTS
jgi:hypothetical protein